MTKEERFILKIYDLSDAKPINRYKVGNTLSLSQKGVDHIVRDLAKSNFIVKVDEDLICLTKNGLQLVKVLTD